MLTVTLHDAQKLDDDLGRRADEHLAFATTFGIDDVVQAVVLMTKSVSLPRRKENKSNSRGRKRGPC